MTDVLQSDGVDAPVIDKLKADVMPDSRTRTIYTPRGAQPSVLGWWVPIFCASCGVEGGRVPQENMDFAMWLCNPCFARYGEIMGMMVMPDEVFWEKLKQEQLTTYGRFLSNDELVSIVEADATPLATLIKTQGR
jgi:hypothetical protein